MQSVTGATTLSNNLVKAKNIAVIKISGRADEPAPNKDGYAKFTMAKSTNTDLTSLDVTSGSSSVADVVLMVSILSFDSK